ncbi:MAG: Hsp33 family molecular chaperone HslO [Ruminococcaceae bacterium]|nr:Hsp33 family molecular chaperone HslO [Oscillospiraceae bacterium]
MGYVTKAIDVDGFVRISFINSRDIVNTAQKIHNTSPVVTAALGRTLTITALMGALLKEPTNNMTVYIKGDGPLGGMVTAADGAGMVKGYAYEPLVDLPLKRGKLDVGGAIGKGSLAISRDLGMKEPYVGKAPLVTGEIGEDFTYYFAMSEQTPTAIALGVLVDTDLTAKQAGGFIVQLMPGAGDDVAVKIEENLRNLPPVTTLLEEGKTPEEIIETIAKGFEIKYLDGATYEYRCDCSMEKISRALISLGKEDLLDMIEKDGGAEITCQFCPKVYRLNKEELTALYESAKE